MIGSNHIPLCLYNAMQQAPVAVVEEPFEARLARLQEEYIDLMCVEYERAYGREAGWQAYAEYLHHGLFAIRRRLGLERYAELDGHLTRALQRQRTATAARRIWPGWCRCCRITTIRCTAISWRRRRPASSSAATMPPCGIISFPRPELR